MEKKKLYLLTTAFPYGTGEKTFIGPELPHLQENFRVTIISGATERDLNDKADRTGLDPEISLFHIDTVVTRLPDKLWGGLRAAFSPVFLEEAFHIIRSGKQVGGRLHWALAYLTAAFRFRDGVLSAGIADGSEDSICYSYWYDLHMLGMLLSRRRFPRMKFVTRAHGADLYNERAEYSWQPFRSFMDRHLDRVFFISEAGRRYYIDHFTHREDPLRYRVCRLGLPEFGKTAPSGTAPSGGTEAETDSRRKNSFLLVSCSTLLPLKRVQLIVEGLALLPPELCIRWVHFGGGPEEEALRRLAADRLGSHRNITCTFTGAVPNRSVTDFYGTERPDCFITTSSTEGIPVSVMEAEAFSMCVIATDVGGMREAVDGNGILLPSDPSPEEVAAGIAALYGRSPDERRKMGERSLCLRRERFDAAANAAAFTAELLALGQKEN